MKSKNTKNKIKLDKHSSASIVLAFTVICFMFTMFMASNQVGKSYAATSLGTAPDLLKTSVQTFAGTSTPVWNFMTESGSDGNETEPLLTLNYDLKTSVCTNGNCTGSYHTYCIEGQNDHLADSVYYKRADQIDSRYAPGLAWILENSYGNSMGTNSYFYQTCSTANGVNGKINECQKYASQYAIWYYLDTNGAHDRSGRTQLKYNAKSKIDRLADSTNTSNYRAVANAIVKFVQQANDYNKQNQEVTNISIDRNNIQYQVSEDGKFLESNEISVTSNKKLSNYVVGFKSNNCEAKIIDISGNEASTFSGSDKFKVRIPVEKLNTLNTVDLVVTVNGNYVIKTVYSYVSRDNPDVDQKIIIPDYTNAEASVSVTLDTKLVRVIKTDKETGKPVIGAVLAIHGADGNEITRFTTTEEPHYLNLAAGNYILKEISSPEGYELSTDEIPFTVTEDATINEVEMKNTPTTKVPDTASTIPAYLYIIGSMILIIGLSVIVFSTKQNKSN